MTQTILNVVRGVEPWQALEKMGIQRNGSHWSFPLYSNSVLITMNDLIMGFKHYTYDKQALQEWATFMLLASDLISFDTIESDPRFDDIMGALWDISFGEDIDFKSIKVLMDM